MVEQRHLEDATLAGYGDGQKSCKNGHSDEVRPCDFRISKDKKEAAHESQALLSDVYQILGVSFDRRNKSFTPPPPLANLCVPFMNRFSPFDRSVLPFLSMPKRRKRIFRGLKHFTKEEEKQRLYPSLVRH